MLRIISTAKVMGQILKRITTSIDPIRVRLSMISKETPIIPPMGNRMGRTAFPITSATLLPTSNNSKPTTTDMTTLTKAAGTMTCGDGATVCTFVSRPHEADFLGRTARDISI
jgi:hypothetical protein